jgi:hypothetical protein
MFLLFKACTQPSLQHLLTSGIYCHCNLNVQEPLSQWTSLFCESISKTNTDFLAHLGDKTTLPDTATRVAHHPIKLGGLGVWDHPLAAKTAYVISLTRSLQYATPPQHTETRTPTPSLSPAHARPLNSHAHPQTTHRLFRLYHALAPQVINTLNAAKPTNPPITSPKQLINNIPLQGLTSTLYTHHSTIRLEAHLDSIPPETLALIRSLLTDTTSLPICSYN